MISGCIPAQANASADKLLRLSAPSRVAASDSSLYSFSQEAQEHAAHFMGWARLCSDPPHDLGDIAAFASDERGKGLSDVVLIGQGGSSQASMTMSSILRSQGMLDVGFHVLDTLSWKVIRGVVEGLDLARTLFVVSSKSGGTMEVLSIWKCVWGHVERRLGAQAAGKRFVAITDPGSKLVEIADSHGFAKVFLGVPEVGGRFSAMSVFGLVPFALMGLDVRELASLGAQAERICSEDSVDNPALCLASFVNECRLRGRDSICFSFSESTQAFGLWLEQLLAESFGKLSRGAMPSIEPDPALLGTPHPNRCAVFVSLASDPDAHTRCDAVHPDTPKLNIVIDDPKEMAAHFVMWEYATAMAGALMEVNPFDQPDVESTKQAVRDILSGNIDPKSPSLDISDSLVRCPEPGIQGYEVSEIMLRFTDMPTDIDGAVSLLFTYMGKGDYFSLNAFLPTEPEVIGALERIRHVVAEKTGVVSSLEMGPRYLHSVGQFQKGGPNKGVFLIVSVRERSGNDIAVPGEGYTLGQLADAQAKGDFSALEAKMRRVVHVRLEDCSVESINALYEKVRRVVHTSFRRP